MKTMIMLALAATLGLVCQNVNAQEEITDKQTEIDALKERKDGIIEKEKELLKKEVTQIMTVSYTHLTLPTTPYV